VAPTVLRGHERAVGAVAISPDSRWLVTTGSPFWTRGERDETARLWDLTSGDPTGAPIVLSGHEDPIFAAAISADSRWLATGSKDGTVRLWDLRMKDPSATPIVLKVQESSIRAMTISADSRWVVTAASGAFGDDRATAQLWHLGIGELLDLVQPVVGRELTAEERKQYQLDEFP